MMRQGRCWQIKPFLNIPNRKTLGPSTDKRKQHIKPGLRSNGSKPLRRLFQFKHEDIQHH